MTSATIATCAACGHPHGDHYPGLGCMHAHRAPDGEGVDLCPCHAFTTEMPVVAT